MCRERKRTDRDKLDVDEKHLMALKREAVLGLETGAALAVETLAVLYIVKGGIVPKK